MWTDLSVSVQRLISDVELCGIMAFAGGFLLMESESEFSIQTELCWET